MKNDFVVRVRRQLSRVGYWTSLLHLTSFAAFLTAVMGSPQWITWVLAAIVFVILFRRQRKSIKRSFRTVGALTSHLTSRYVLLATAAVLSARHGHSSSWVVATSAVLPAVGMSGEPLIRNLNRRAAVPSVANIDGIPDRSRPRLGYGSLFLVNVVLVLLVFLDGAGVRHVMWGALVVAVVGVAVVAACINDLYGRLRTRIETEGRIGEIVESLQPQFVIHWNAPARTAYQIAMWLPYLDRIGVPYFVLVRSIGNFRDVEKITDRPIVLRRSLEELDPVVVPTLKGAFYVNTATRNDHLIRYPQLRHIQLNHGDSDKVPSFNPVFRIYDKDFVAGQAAIDRFAANGVHMHPDLFRIVGRPQVEDVEINGAGRAAPDGEPSAFYAPTWSGFYQDSNYSSLSIGPQMIRALLDRGCRVVFRPHPYSRRSAVLRAARDEIYEMLAADAQQTGREHLYGPVAETEMSVFECFNASDFMISDVSSVVNDFLYSAKPFAMVAMGRSAESFEREFPVSRAAYILTADESGAHNFDEVVTELLETDPKAAQREQLKSYYLGEPYPGGPAQRFVDEARAELGVTQEDVDLWQRADEPPAGDSHPVGSA